jgi:hypothetical protein
MTKKNFLPMTISDMPNVYKPTTSAIKMGSKSPWLTKIFSVLAFLSVIFGGTIMGFSFKTVRDGQVGYYNNEPGYFTKGMYFQLPWTFEDMNIVDVGLGFLDFEKVVSADALGREFYIETISLRYEVKDIDKYVAALKTSKTKKYCENEIKISVLTEISKQTNRVVSDLQVPSCGLVVVNLDFSPLVLGTLIKKNDTYEMIRQDNVTTGEEEDSPSIIIVAITTTVRAPESGELSTTLTPSTTSTTPESGKLSTTSTTSTTPESPLPNVVIKDLDIKVSDDEIVVTETNTF